MSSRSKDEKLHQQINVGSNDKKKINNRSKGKSTDKKLDQ